MTIPTAARRQNSATLLTILLVAPFLAAADATIANVATPAIRTSLHASGTATQFVVGGYIVAYAVLLITGARLGQTHGYKRLFLIGAAAFGATSLAGGLAPDITLLVAMRVLQGAAAALMFPQTLTGIQLNFAGEHRTRAIGLLAMALSTGAVVGQLLGGFVVSADLAGTSWRPSLLINVPVCGALLIAAARTLPTDRRDGHADVDVVGVLTLSISVLLVAVPLTVGPDLGWPDWTWFALAGSAPAFAVFLATQRRSAADGRTPLVDPAVLARPSIAWGLLGLLGSSGTYFALLFTLAQYFQIGLGYSAVGSGLLLLPWLAAFGVAGHAARGLQGRFGFRPPVAGCLLLATAYLGLSAAALAGDPAVPLLIPLFALGGFGLGIAFTGLLGHLTNAVAPRHAPDISGISSTSTQIGGSLGVAGFGSLYLALSHGHSAGHAFGMTTLAFAVTGALATAAAHLATRPAGQPLSR